MNPVNPQEKQININGLNINYKQIGKGDVPIVLLHGWGVSSDKYLELAKCLSQFSIFNFQFSIIIPDLPGFGKSEEPKEDWELDDYVEFADKFIEKANRKSGFELVKNLLKKFKQKDFANLTHSKPLSRGELPRQNQQIQTPQPPLSRGRDNTKIILIGHSFGGRIAIKYAAKYPEKINKLILTGAAGIKHKLTFKQRMFFILAKIGKKIFSIFLKTKLPIGNLVSFSRKFLYKLAGEKDYCKASLRMKEIMKNALNEDLTLILDEIKIPTLLAWGANDNSTPLSDGKIMNEKIENSELVIFNGANHSLPYQEPKEFAKAVLEFIKKEV